MKTVVKPFAWGLQFPTHLEWVDDGDRLLASTPGAGMIFDITRGGDFARAKPFCSYLKAPGGIVQLDDGRILASDRLTEYVYDITSGDKATPKVFASGLTFPYGLVKFNEMLFVTEDNVSGFESRLANISRGGRLSAASIHAHGLPIGRTEYMGRESQIMRNGSWSGTGTFGRLLLANGHLGKLFDVTKKFSFKPNGKKPVEAFAWGFGSPLGMHSNPKNGHLYVADTTRAVIYEVTEKGGDFSFAPAFATGFVEPSCIRWNATGSTAFVCDKRAGIVFKIDVVSW